MRGFKIQDSFFFTALFAVLFQYLQVVSQNYFPQNIEPPLTKIDSIYAANLTELQLQPEYLLRGTTDLPYEINNAELPFFRTVFSQEEYWNCGQSAGIGYNFTYETNQSRNLSGLLSENQYSVNFSYNFNNTGAGWGVSYFHSFDVLKKCGNPNLIEYGGLFNGGETRWMSGYELYENAMHNRIREVYSIDVGTPEGLLTLKHWLNDHMDGSQYGGVANFYFGRYWSTYLPEDSPEAGQWTVIECSAPATHALTVVGYNDSIRFDVNMDGRYTNNEDINDDGIVDMRDWEIGGLRYMNSILYNDGYGLIMYRTLALRYGEGGIWNNQVHVIDIKEDYEPLATMRLKIKHNSRNKLKLIAGVSQDTNSVDPEHTIDFPIFNYQGGNYYMQGNNLIESNKTIELSLDISPLLSFVEPGSDAKYFIQVAEKDEFDEGQGEVLFLSVVDYQNSQNETLSDQFPKTISNNTITKLSLVKKFNFDKLSITTDEHLAIVPGENANCQISAKGGKPPYNWEVLQPYHLNSIALNFPENKSNQLHFYTDPFYGVSVNLPFDFLFYSDTLNSITVYKEGIIMFDNKPYPYPYFIGEQTMLKNQKAIAPFLTNMVLVDDEDDGVWVNIRNDYYEVVWKASFEWYENETNVEFAVRLFPDGKIETHYNEMKYPESITWCSGISSGDKNNYIINSFDQQIDDLSFRAYQYSSQENLPKDIKIDQNGLLSFIMPDSSDIIDITIQAKDDLGIIDQKSFQLQSELFFEYKISAGDDDKINPFDTASLELTVKNNSSEIIDNLGLDFSTDEVYYSVLNDHASVGTLIPGQSKTLDSVLVVIVHPDIPDHFYTCFSGVLTSGENSWSADIGLIAHSPNFKFSEIEVVDNQNGFLEPGEVADIEIMITNTGHMDIEDFNIKMDAYQEYLNVENPVAHINKLNIGESTIIKYNVQANQSLNTGLFLDLLFSVELSDIKIAEVEKKLMVGKIPVLILDFENTPNSVPVLKDLFNELQLTYDYKTTYPANYDHYMSVFICLGKLFNNVEISNFQADKLSSFLTNGGSIYLEGRETWLIDKPENLLDHFGVATVSNGNYFKYDSIYGENETYANGMTFGYFSSIPLNNYYLIPEDNAHPLLNSAVSDSSCVITYNSGNYKTVASSIEFGSLVDTDTLSSKENYLLGILDFFGLTDYLLSIKTPQTTMPVQDQIQAFPNPFSQHINFEIEIESDERPSFKIYDLSGRMVKQLDLIYQGKQHNSYSAIWDGRDEKGNILPTGFYVTRCKADDKIITKKILRF